jgi:hypothetical protein
MSAKNVLMGHQEGDAVSNMPKRSAQEELAKYQLLKEKLMVKDGAVPVGMTKSSVAILGAMSEVEVLTLQIATKLSTDAAYSQHTAAYEQLANLSGETSYIGIAEYLANEIYELNRGKFILDQFSRGADIESLAVNRRSRPGLFTALGDIAVAAGRALGGGAGGPGGM